VSGKVIARPERRHDCAPGWTYGPVSDGIRDAEPPFDVLPGHGLAAGSRRAYPPDSRLYPKGTVWECECGRAWVSTGPVAWNSPGFINFRREHWWERRRRLDQVTEDPAELARKVADRDRRIAELERELGIGQ
jgi:hypothetical protein